jgi:dephospho-CoA kinase
MGQVMSENGIDRMVIIGIIGTPAGGKSTVARRLREHGATWINADRIAHRVLQSRSVVEQIAARFGPQMLTREGRIDRARLAEVVFGDDANQREGLRYLESVIHPATRRRVLRRLTTAGRYEVVAAVLDAPLLLEADWGVLCDAVWCVDASEEQRQQWIASRGWTLSELRRRERRQMPIQEKRRLSTSVIENDSDLVDLIAQTDKLWDQLMDRVRACVPDGRYFDPSHCLQNSSSNPT